MEKTISHIYVRRKCRLLVCRIRRKGIQTFLEYGCLEESFQNPILHTIKTPTKHNLISNCQRRRAQISKTRQANIQEKRGKAWTNFEVHIYIHICLPMAYTHIQNCGFRYIHGWSEKDGVSYSSVCGGQGKEKGNRCGSGSVDDLFRRELIEAMIVFPKRKCMHHEGKGGTREL